MTRSTDAASAPASTRGAGISRRTVLMIVAAVLLVAASVTLVMRNRSASQADVVNAEAQKRADTVRQALIDAEAKAPKTKIDPRDEIPVEPTRAATKPR